MKGETQNNKLSGDRAQGWSFKLFLFGLNLKMCLFLLGQQIALF